MRFVYPEGKNKALTFSYDDGQIHDRKLVEILNRHGMKGTFHLNSGMLAQDRNHDVFLAADEVAELLQAMKWRFTGCSTAICPRFRGIRW